MTTEYSVEVCKTLEKKFSELSLHRPMRILQYDDGDKLVYDVTSVLGEKKGGSAKISLRIEKFVGGGFAGQVYKVKIEKIENGPVEGLKEDNTYAMKILVPPSRGSLLFRNLLYGIGFQGPFQLQINPAAARSGALWQKFIKRAARIRFGDDRAVNDIHATFIDHNLGSCGELSDWVEGRTWRLEVDEYLDLLKQWKKSGNFEDEHLGSPEYRVKRQFMSDFVKLLHEMGAHEFARQYVWSTWKSQPNCLKRTETEGDPAKGLIAVDFRAGLALLPFLPMSPGDVMLILQGIGRGSIVQFDRGSSKKLEKFVNEHKEDFADMEPMLAELKTTEQVYRNSIPDITHNHVRLLYSGKLWSTMLSSAVTGWEVRNTIDRKCNDNLKNNKFLTIIFILIGLIPFLGAFIRRLWGRADYRKHYASLLTSFTYFKNAIFGKIFEKVIRWHRAGRVEEQAALRIAGSFPLFLIHFPFSILPVGIHKFFTSWEYLKERLNFIVIRPFRLYFNAELREQWLRDMVDDGKEKHIISNEDAETILSQIKEPFIQKYLKSLAVHVLTLPVTQIVSVIIAIIYVVTHPEMPRAQSWGIGVGIIALFQVIPLSPGSLTRGLYVLYLVIKEKNFKDYNIAVFLGFFKYIGYLAFPIQMTYRYPTLARFMAGHWATEAVHVVPVFGETGALLEHGVYYLFYNWPLTIRRRMRERAQLRSAMKARYWHIGLCAAITAGIFGSIDYFYFSMDGTLPGLSDIWWLSALLPLCCGIAVTLGCGGAKFWKRIIAAVFCGIFTSLFYTALSAYIGYGGQIDISALVIHFIWRMFLFSVLSSFGAVLIELR